MDTAITVIRIRACDNCGDSIKDPNSILCVNCRPSHKMTRFEILAELQKAQNEIDSAYWTFTRTARGKPPMLVCPNAFTRRAELEETLRETK